MLPVLLSIPHGGVQTPPELTRCLNITKRDLFNDSDPFSKQIYDLGDKVQNVIKADVARTFVDLNRSMRDLPPQNPDGLIKHTTCWQVPIYTQGMEPDPSMIQILIERYYTPYHNIIKKGIRDQRLKLCLDCHTMTSTAPGISPDDTGKSRPKFCLSNRNDRSSPQWMALLLADCISESFRIDRDEISINDPFCGGYITRQYGNNPVPWIQIEMNRDLYLTKNWFDSEKLTINKDRLEALNNMFGRALSLFFDES